MKNNILIVATREYIRVVRKISFWLATLAMPALIVFASAVSGYSSAQTAERIQEQAQDAKAILVMDEADLIRPEFLMHPLTSVSDKQFAVAEVRAERVDAFIYVGADIYTTQKAEIYTINKGVFSGASYSELVQNLIEQSILSEIQNNNKLELLQANLDIQTTEFRSGEEVYTGIERFLLPGIAMTLYFLMIILSSGYLLMSVSEEKENRMIETILSTMGSRDLIWGKIVGQVGIVLTQLITLISLAALMFIYSKSHFPIEIDFSRIELSWLQIASSVFYLFAGFLILANSMVAVGAVMPSYKEAQSFSGVFIMLSIFPIYFITLILTDPNGIVASITSYFPFTAAMVLLFRNSLGELSVSETLLSSGILVLYVVISFYLAYKFFELGALEYKNKLNLRQIFSSWFAKK